jgi:hypothetical protein
MNIRSVLLWLPMIAIAFINAAIREVFLIGQFNNVLSHQLSTISLIILCTFYVFLIYRFLGLGSYKQAALVGLTWAILTIIFETILGFMNRTSWNDILQQYNFVAGNIWALFILCLFFLPLAAYALMHHRER